MLHAQARQRHSSRVRDHPLHRQRPRLPPTNLKLPINVFFPHDDFTCKRKKFHIFLDVFKLADSDNENVRDLYANECLNDGLKSKSIEKVNVQKAMGSSATW